MGSFGALLVGIFAGFALSFNLLMMMAFLQQENVLIEQISMHSPDEEYHKYEDILAKKFAAQVKILCVVLVSPTRAAHFVHIQNTWSKRCNQVVFFNGGSVEINGTVALPMDGCRSCFWKMVKESLKMVDDRMASMDWALVVDDLTYVIIENLRYLLSGQNSSEAVALGRLESQGTSTPAMSVGAGFVISREAAKIVKGSQFQNCMNDETLMLDSRIFKCLQQVGVKRMDTKDSLGRGRFFSTCPMEQLKRKSQNTNGSLESSEQNGFNCCSDLSVTFRTYNDLNLYIMEFLVYHVRPHGVSQNFGAKLNVEDDEDNTTLIFD